jgi:hypothetical protein
LTEAELCTLIGRNRRALNRSVPGALRSEGLDPEVVRQVLLRITQDKRVAGVFLDGLLLGLAIARERKGIFLL